MARPPFAFAFESITVTDTAVGLTLSNVLAKPHPKKVEIFVETAQVRFRKDGTDPTATVGEVLNPFERMTLESLNDMQNLKTIRTGATSGTLRVHYLR